MRTAYNYSFLGEYFICFILTHETQTTTEMCVCGVLLYGLLVLLSRSFSNPPCHYISALHAFSIPTPHLNKAHSLTSHH